MSEKCPECGKPEQECRVEYEASLEDEIKTALYGVVKAWEATRPGSTNKSEIQRWLVEDMKPAIDIARSALTHCNSKA